MPNYTIDDRPDGVLKNKLGVTRHDELERLEAGLVAARYAEIKCGYGPSGHFDADHLRAIHRHLFQDVYEWAGHTRAEPFRLPDGTIASELTLHKPEGAPFLSGVFVPGNLDRVASSLRDADYLRGLSRDEFAQHAADTMAQINSIHPFREGNGRTQRVFMEQLADQAGHTLDFSVVSRERMIECSIAAHERNDLAPMRRLIDEISNPVRVTALREACEFLDRNNFPWNDRYIATVESGRELDLVFVGMQGEHFMARTDTEILIGRSSDLPEPSPEQGERFAFAASERCWERLAEEHRREDQHRMDARPPAASELERSKQEDAEAENKRTKGEMTDAKSAKPAKTHENDDASANRRSFFRELDDEADRDGDNDHDGGRDRGR